MRLCVNSKAMQVKVQREKESSNGTIVTKMEQWKKIVTHSLTHKGLDRLALILNNINEIVSDVEKDQHRLAISWYLNDNVQAIPFDTREHLWEW